MDGTGPGNLNKVEFKAWQSNLIKFLIPLLVLYSGQITGALQFAGFEYTYQNLLSVLLPTPVTVGGMLLYFFNAITDLSRKYLGDNR